MKTYNITTRYRFIEDKAQTLTYTIKTKFPVFHLIVLKPYVLSLFVFFEKVIKW